MKQIDLIYIFFLSDGDSITSELRILVILLL